MNWIAFGILFFLAVSTLASSRRVRAFSGAAALAAVMVAAALSILGTRLYSAKGSTASAAAPTAAPAGTWNLFVFRPNMQETAEATSERLLAEMSQKGVAETIDEAVEAEVEAEAREDSSTADGTKDPELSPTGTLAHSLGSAATSGEPRKRLMRVKLAGSKPQDKIKLLERISDNVRQYLDWYRAHNTDVGVDRLEPEDLNWTLLQAVYRGQDKMGRKYLSLVFDDNFHEHVRQRGRQVVTKDHLAKAAYTSLGTLGVLTSLFGFLKFRRGRRRLAPDSDHLASRGISLV